jgi:hypothetical protein
VLSYIARRLGQRYHSAKLPLLHSIELLVKAMFLQFQRFQESSKCPHSARAAFRINLRRSNALFDGILP